MVEILKVNGFGINYAVDEDDNETNTINSIEVSDVRDAEKILESVNKDTEFILYDEDTEKFLVVFPSMSTKIKNGDILILCGDEQ